AITYFPLFAALGKYGNPTLIAAQETAPVTVIADPAECSFQFNPVGTSSFTTSCDIAKSFLARNAVNYSNEAAPAGTIAKIRIGDQVIESFVARAAGAEAAALTAAFTKTATEAIRSHGYPAAADPAKINMFMMTLILT